MKFTFGKYAGRDVLDMADESPSYVYWAARAIPEFKAKLRANLPALYDSLLATERAMRGERDAWAYTGGRLPNFDSVYRRMAVAKARQKVEVPR